MANQIWQAWDDGNGGTTFAPRARCVELVSQGLLSESAKLLHEIEACTGEEAMSLHFEKMGFAPYQPAGEPCPCPKGCGSMYYPEGYGDCPNCGHIA